jgi:hypothetical protein
MITFSDGMSFDTEGPLRIACRSDGWYVIGCGMLCPVQSLDDGEKLILKLKQSDPNYYNR